MKDNLWDRMKRYENVNRNFLSIRNDVIIRIDWRAFHSYTKQFNKPFDSNLKDILIATTIELAKEIQWFKCAYLQSDEISIRINDLQNIDSQWWFDYNINKIVSISSSIFTAYFNKLIAENLPNIKKLATFDSRCFTIPRKDLPNYFLRRMKDWYRNSLQMYSRSMFSQKQLHKKWTNDMIDMCRESGSPRENLNNQWKNWTFVIKKDWEFEIISDIRPTFESIYQFIKDNSERELSDISLWMSE